MGNRFENRVAIITGAGRGIGREVAKLIASEGGSVVVNDFGVSLDGMNSSNTPAAEVVNEITEAGGKAVANYDSVSEWDSSKNIVQTAIDHFGKVDILCNAAGILRDRMIFNMTEEEWDGVLRVHLYGTFNMVRHCVPLMIQQTYGRILLFSSGSALGASGQANYSAAKEGIVGLARSLSRELYQYNITLNAVYPGGATRMTESIPETTTQLRQTQRAKSTATQSAPIRGPEAAKDPINNAPKVVYLCSESSGNLTGQVVGTSGWPMTLYSPRHVIRSIHKNSRWTIEELEDLIPISLAPDIVNPSPPTPPKNS